MSRQLQLEIDAFMAAPPGTSGKSAADLEREIVQALESPDPDKVAAYEEKLEAKRERLSAASAKHSARAKASYASAKARADAIPFGQPILVGHHSERRHRGDIAKIDRGMRRSFEESDRAKELARAAERVGTAGISSDDPAAVVKLKQELAGLTRDQEKMKQINATIRKHLKGGEAAIVPALVAIGLSDKAARDALKPDFAGRIGIPDYAIKNNGANIRRIEKRIAELTTKAVTPSRASRRGELPGGMTFEISENKDANRTQILFSGKPDDAVRARLKAGGFRWAPSEGVWQRQLSNGAWYHAHRALGLDV